MLCDKAAPARVAHLTSSQFVAVWPAYSSLQQCNSPAGYTTPRRRAPAHDLIFTGRRVASNSPNVDVAMRSDSRLNVVIVGGGIGGLFAANALISQGLRVSVYEQAPALGEIGAGVFMTPNSVRQLQRVGLGS